MRREEPRNAVIETILAEHSCRRRLRRPGRQPRLQLSAQNTVAIDNDDIGGVVTGANGPEAGVWVIAETKDLPTRYAKMVVTDDQGRYVVPDLPKAKYQVWVRGYGLVDSPKVDGEPGQQLNLRAVTAPNEKAAAQVLSGDLLVLDAEDSGCGPVRRQERHSRRTSSRSTGST